MCVCRSFTSNKIITLFIRLMCFLELNLFHILKINKVRILTVKKISECCRIGVRYGQCKRENSMISREGVVRDRWSLRKGDRKSRFDCSHFISICYLVTGETLNEFRILIRAYSFQNQKANSKARKSLPFVCQ